MKKTLVSILSVAFAVVLQAASYSYKTMPSEPDSAKTLATLNSMGASGYAYVGDYQFDEGQRTLFVHGLAGSPFKYKTVPYLLAYSAPTILATLNEQGAVGYRFVGEYIMGTEYVLLFVQDSSGSRFSYAHAPMALEDTRETAVKLFNERGAQGQRFVTAYAYAMNTEYRYLFEDNLSSTATYRYELNPTELGVGAEESLAEANMQGARGFEFKTTYSFADGYVDIFEHSTGGSGAPNYNLEESIGGETAKLKQLNEQGALNRFFLSDYMFGANDIRALFVGYGAVPKVAGRGDVVGTDIRHSNGNIFDQILINGRVMVFSADPGQITRASYVDMDDDIVQIEFSGRGTVYVTLEGQQPAALPVKYNQNVSYVKGVASIIIDGADASTNLSVFTVGRVTAVNQALFRSDVTYDGRANIARLTIRSSDGRFGGLRCANTVFGGDKDWVGIDARGVSFVGPIYVFDVKATGAAVPKLFVAGENFRITGGDLGQPNGKAIIVGSNTSNPVMAAGSDSHGNLFPAQTLKGTFVKE